MVLPRLGDVHVPAGTALGDVDLTEADCKNITVRHAAKYGEAGRVFRVTGDMIKGKQLLIKAFEVGYTLDGAWTPWASTTSCWAAVVQRDEVGDSR